MHILHDDKNNLWYLVLLILLTLVTAKFADVLFFANNLVLSKEGTDIFHQFLYWRDFGFGQLKNGNLSLWNPHIFSGAPFLGGFQSALLYPPNLLFLLLPLGKAINFSIAFHVVLIGFFMYLWTNDRGLHPLACLFSSILVMFSGPYLLHIYAGHLSNLCTMVWVPLLFLCIDRIFDHFSMKWILIGIFTIAMLILAGHPQYVYYAAVAAFIYTLLCLVKSSGRIRIIISLAVMCLGSLLLSAMQVLCGLDAANETVRSIGLPYEFSKMFSFPPENILTFFAPNFFGDMVHIPYWGRCYLWEMSLFISITGFALAVYGSVYGNRSTRRFSLTMVIILLFFALGAHTPLFKLLYQWLPGFNSFRGTSKFIFPLSLFFIMLAGIGMDHLIRNKHQVILATVIIFGFGVILAVSSLLISFSTDGSIRWNFWESILQYMAETGESYLATVLYTDEHFIHESALFSSKALMNSAAICFILSLLFVLTKHHNITVYFIVLLALIEMFIFAGQATPAFDMDQLMSQNNNVAKFIKQHPGDYRILNLIQPNSSMSIGAQDIWGYDAAVSLRYARFMYFTQGFNPDHVTQYVNFKKIHRLFSMLRCRYIFFTDKDKISAIDTKDAMNHIHLISNWQVINNEDDILKEMEKESFNPRQMMILESSPDIQPSPKSLAGEVRIESSSVNNLILRGKIDQAALLLITDSYSKSWKATPLKDSAQHVYHVMPANFTLMAIPLKAGEHHLKLEYRPTAFVVGRWLSISAWIIYLILIIFMIIRGLIVPNGMTRLKENEKEQP